MRARAFFSVVALALVAATATALFVGDWYHAAVCGLLLFFVPTLYRVATDPRTRL